jgi:predicted AlkP superfamily phosphohydrolase/phosphomutase
MKAQEILSKIKEVVGIELSEEVSVQLEEIKLDNGTVLVAEKFESGQSVFIKSEDDENIALPIGEYDMEDGRKLMVKEEGLIDAIGEVEVEEEVEASEETATEEEKVEETELEEEEMKYVTKEEFSKAVEEIKGMIEAMDHKDKEEMSDEVVEKEELSAEVAEPVVHNPEAKSETKSSFKKSYPNTIQNRIYQKLNQ